MTAPHRLPCFTALASSTTPVAIVVPTAPTKKRETTRNAGKTVCKTAMHLLPPVPLPSDSYLVSAINTNAMRALGANVWYMVFHFRTLACPYITNPHAGQGRCGRGAHCLFFHNQQEHRRLVAVPANFAQVCGTPPTKAEMLQLRKTFPYRFSSCAAHHNHACKLGVQCPEAHSISEHLYHPERFRRLPCKPVLYQSRECRFDGMCAFYHSLLDYLA